KLFTVWNVENEFLEKFCHQTLKRQIHSPFARHILLPIATHYNGNLRLLRKTRLRIQCVLQNNDAINQLSNLMEVEKSLVYVLAALRGNESIVKKLFRLPAIKRFEEEDDLLEDLVIENNQALETTRLYTDILESITTSYASLLSNEMNNTMK